MGTTKRKDPHISQNSLESARVVVPLLLEYVPASSVLDCGCKHGEWLSIFRQQGTREVQGFDRPVWELLINDADFKEVDLSRPFVVDRTYDLSMCIEVAEHLPRTAAAPLVEALTTAAPVVVFSAALPGQGGKGHLNEQPHAYWDALFAGRGFKKIDCVRPRIWQDPRVAWWYRQNMFIYANDHALACYPALRAEAERSRATDLRLVHEEVLEQQAPVREAIKRPLRRMGVPTSRAWYS
jgi:hypothetical protein